MIIDIHAHIGTSWLGWGDEFSSFEEMVNLYNKYKIDKVCLSSFLIFYDPPRGNKEVYEVTRRYPDRFIGFAVISPRYGEKAVYEEIDKCITTYQMKAIKVHPSANQYHADSYVIDPVMEKAIQYDVPVHFHTWSDEYSNPYRIENIAKRFPKAKIIMAHIGFEDWLDAIYVAKKHENVYLDTAGCLTERAVIRQAIRECGDDRIVWGSDSPTMNLGAELAKIIEAPDVDISEQAKEKILYKNAKKLLKLNI